LNVLELPDCNLLEKKILSWLKNITWNGSVSASKRFGTMFDSKAKEELVTL